MPVSACMIPDAPNEEPVETQGLKVKYHLTKADGSPVDPNARYFVLRLDAGAEPNHRKACIAALSTYAAVIQPHLPELARDLRQLYLSKNSDNAIIERVRAAFPGHSIDAEQYIDEAFNARARITVDGNVITGTWSRSIEQDLIQMHGVRAVDVIADYLIAEIRSYLSK